MVMLHNPALSVQPRNQPAGVIPLRQEESLLNWLENTGRLVGPSSIEVPDYSEVEAEELEEIMEPMLTYGYDEEMADPEQLDQEDESSFGGN
jgi:GTP-dependent phosphoenolpyruvate carboxykinase